MGLLNKRNLAKAKALAEKNKEKIASGVNKATDAIDKRTGGKHSDKLKKIDDAARKFAGDDQTSDDGQATTTPSAADTAATTGTTPPAGDADTTTNR